MNSRSGALLVLALCALEAVASARSKPRPKASPEAVSSPLSRAAILSTASTTAVLSLGTGMNAAASPTPAPTPSHSVVHPVKVMAPEAPKKNAPAPVLDVKPGKSQNGGVVLATVTHLFAGDVVSATFAGDSLPVTAGEGSATFLVGIDLMVSAGKYPITVRVKRAGKTITTSYDLPVKDAKYPVQKLSLDPKKVSDMDEETNLRILREARVLSAMWPQWTEQRYWSGAFQKPLTTEWSEFFGGRRIINGLERSPHSGIDQRGKEGDPIRAINAGKVVFTGDQFFTGNLTILDHGQGVYSMYFHQSQFLVSVGQSVAKGEVIGKVGNTGRTTGPHLHWGVRIASARVDPQQLLALDLPETAGSLPAVLDTSGSFETPLSLGTAGTSSRP